MVLNRWSTAGTELFSGMRIVGSGLHLKYTLWLGFKGGFISALFFFTITKTNVARGDHQEA